MLRSMIEPNGTPIDVLGAPNRQTKVPMGGTPQRNPYGTAVQPQAQDHAGYGTPGTQGFNDTPPPKTRHDKCTIQAQDAGAVSGFSLGGEINKGAANTIGMTAVPAAAYTGFNTAGGRNQISHGDTIANPGNDVARNVTQESDLLASGGNLGTGRSGDASNPSIGSRGIVD